MCNTKVLLQNIELCDPTALWHIQAQYVKNSFYKYIYIYIILLLPSVKQRAAGPQGIYGKITLSATYFGLPRVR